MFPSIVLGYHGCDAAIAERVLSGHTSLKPSQNDYDWLADGIYFWEHNAQRAYDFAVEIARRPHPSAQSIAAPAVVGAMIDLGYCLNLLDSRYISMVRDAHGDLINASKATGIPLPMNTGGNDLVSRRLDCAVIRTVHQQQKTDGKPPFDNVRAAFFEGERLYDHAGFAAKNHIQICVRNSRCIKAYFRVLDEDGQPVSFG